MPLLAYLFFLKDMDRFMPISPRRFDRAFHTLGIRFKRKDSWENYATYNGVLDSPRPHIAEAAGLESVRLIDAQTFCWILADEGMGKDYDEARGRAIEDMLSSVVKTVRNSNGLLVQRRVKSKCG